MELRSHSIYLLSFHCEMSRICQTILMAGFVIREAKKKENNSLLSSSLSLSVRERKKKSVSYQELISRKYVRATTSV